MPATRPLNWIVLTTIHPPSAAFRRLPGSLGDEWAVVVVGDAHTPPEWEDVPVDFLSLKRQRDLFGAFAAEAPTNHYSRKNFGYLYARQRGAVRLLEVDDDCVLPSPLGDGVTREVRGRLVGGGDWVNVYGWFTDRLIWPRGLPLDAIRRRGDLLSPDAIRECPVQQFLVDGDPDVDAVFRYVFPHTGFAFDPAAAAVVLDPGTWCPFNSQNTLWFEDAFPLLYLPHHATFRVTDIWRALVAQRALWLSGRSVAFHTSTLSHVRNRHDALRDFVDEIPSHVKNRAIAGCLDRVAGSLAGCPMAEAARALWLALVDADLLPAEEARHIQQWHDAVSRPPQRSYP